MTHILADSLTISGVPFGWWSDRRFHIEGGRLVTGSPQEYFVVAGVVLVCILIGGVYGNV